VHAECEHRSAESGEAEMEIECEGCYQPAPAGYVRCEHEKDPRECATCIAELAQTR
jgi:hypothetical protein